MNSIDYRHALDRARHDLAFAIQQRDLWNLRIVQAQNAVRSMAAMAADAQAAEEQQREMGRQVGIAQAIEALVNGSPQALFASDVREGLRLYGYDIDRYQNPVSLIQQTLQRLARGGRIRHLPVGAYTRTPFYEALLMAGR